MTHLLALLTLLLTTVVAPNAIGLRQTPDTALRAEIDAFNASLVAAFKRDPASVARFYTDDALIAGGGQRADGRDAVDAYWKGATMFTNWTLETLQTGGTRDAPWLIERSVVTGAGGRTMETFFLGLLRRLPSGELKMFADIYSRDRKSLGPNEMARISDVWSKASRGDAGALKLIRDDPFALLAPARDPAGPTPPAAQQSNASLVDAVAGVIADRYVFPDVGAKIAGHVRERARESAYDKLTGGALADALTADLRKQNGDRHLSVTYQSGQTAQPAASGAGPVRRVPGAPDPNADLNRRRNYFLNRAERLDGNVGYLDVRRFFSQSAEARDAAAAAMAFLAQTDAMIIDVRYVPGGDVGMVDLLASYFFDKVVPTLATYFRPRDETLQRTTLASVPGRRRPDIPVYVLTSRDTGSAAEDFAFLMRQTGRATLVGDRTAGAGHSNVIVGLGGGYSMSVSVGRTYDPKTNEGWEGTGVQPHVRGASADALDIAHRLALSALIEKAQDSANRQELSWTRDALDARRSPVVVPPATMASYAGQYGVRHVTFNQGRLWYQRGTDAEKIPMLPVSLTDFAMAEGQRVQFVLKDGLFELRFLQPDGTHVAYPRQRQ